MTTKFAIVAGPRTGSTTILNFLEDLGVFVYREPFRPSKGKFDFNARLNQIYFVANAPGMKHLYSHVNPLANQVILNWLYERGIVVIRLIRRNVFDQAMSLAIANHMNIWELNNKDLAARYDYAAVEEFNIDPGVIKSNMQWLATLQQAVFDVKPPSFVKVTTVAYEQLFNVEFDTAKIEIERVLSFIELDPPAYTEQMIREHFAPIKKQNTPVIYKRIANLAALREEFEHV